MEILDLGVEQAPAINPLPAEEPEKRFRVLAAEDNPVFQTMLRTMLTKWGYDVTLARDGAEAWEILQRDGAPRLALLDWMMPGMDGVELCRMVRASRREPYIYILLLTARTESHYLVEGMEAGADDYLTKPINSHELRVRLRAGMRILRLQEELVQAREALRDQAMHDGLTGLLNRASILEALQSALSRGCRGDEPVSVMMMDIDRFKQTNDTYGHLAGDAVLRETASRMKAAVRRYDSVGRYGGEEFLIVLPGCAVDAAYAQAERVREAVASQPFQAGPHSLSITCSIGVAGRAHPTEADTDSLVREADVALYLAKGRGRNRVELPVQPPNAADPALASI